MKTFDKIQEVSIFFKICFHFIQFREELNKNKAGSDNNNNLNNLNNLELNDIIQNKKFYLEKLKNLKNELITIEKKIYIKK